MRLLSFIILAASKADFSHSMVQGRWVPMGPGNYYYPVPSHKYNKLVNWQEVHHGRL